MASNPSPRISSSPECFGKDPQGHQFHALAQNGWGGGAAETAGLGLLYTALVLGSCTLRQWFQNCEPRIF